jgi:2-phospho-L-lactate guanylyltransferase
MTIWAIVPVKPLNESKSRLSKVLSRKERKDMSEKMLVNTLNVLGEVSEIDRTMVVSRDSRALSIARDLQARTLAESGTPDLNGALERATAVARGYGISAVLVLPADLPLLSVEDVHKIISNSNDPPVVVIAPDRHQQGTNALLTSPPGIIEYDFGKNSFARHVQLAERSGARVEICDLPTLGLDLDNPEDLELLEADFDLKKGVE